VSGGSRPAAIKAELSALGAATELGFEAGGESVDAIKALAADLEALNPTPAPARADALLKGRWRLLYSSFGLQRQATLGRLSFNVLPRSAPIRVERLFQEVDPATGLYDNVVEYIDESGVSGVSLTIGMFSPADDRRMDVVFTHAQATGYARTAIDNARIPPLWSEVTYLDEDFRLNRGSYGSLYVLALDARAPARWTRDALA
jgi:hypothetical protein